MEFVPKKFAHKNSKNAGTFITPRWQSYLFIGLNSLIWAAAFVVVKPALEFTTPLRFLWYRYVLACLCSLPILYYYWQQAHARFSLPATRKIFHLKTILMVITPLELVGTTLALALVYAGLSRTTALEANFLAMSSPLFITLGGILFLKEKQERHEWVGLSLAVLGTLLLILLPVFYGQTQWQGLSLFGNILIMGHNVATAGYYLLAKRIYHPFPKLLVATLSFWVGLISFTFLALGELWGQINLGAVTSLTVSRLSNFWLAASQTIAADLSHPQVWIASGYMATFGSIIALTAYIKGQDGMEASEASWVSYLQPLVYIPLSMVVLGEQLYGLQLVSLGLILVGVWWAEKRK